MKTTGSKIKQSAVLGGICTLAVLGAVSGAAAGAEDPAPRPAAIDDAVEIWCIVDGESLGMPDALARCQSASYWDPAPIA